MEYINDYYCTTLLNMKKGSHLTKESKQRISKGLRKFFESNHVWNKGLKYGKYEEPASKRFRRNKEYYLKELELNAKRNAKYKYDDKRKDEIKIITENYHKITGKGRPPREWGKEEIKYLRDNYKKPRLEICKYLGRSWASVGHKVTRLGLQKYNKWIN